MSTTDPLLTTPEIEKIFSAELRIQRMLDFEAALAFAQCETGLFSVPVRDAIIASCQAKHFDADSIFNAARSGGNAAIPLVASLMEQVAKHDASAGAWVHWGATSQDVLDTAMILQLREATDLIAVQLIIAESQLAKLAQKHLRTPMVARTLLQQATAITLGYKLAIWGHGIERARAALIALHIDAFALQLGGAVGTLSVLASGAESVKRAAAAHLGLRVPIISWHVQRDRMIAIGNALAITVTACAKLSQDLMLMMQSEVGEAVESASNAGGSSAMPNKRNPVRALVAVAAAANVGGLMAGLYGNAVHAHERADGAWHGEWFALPQLAALAHASACATAYITSNVAFSVERMQQHLESGGGLVAAEALTAALAKSGGKLVARQTVERLCAEVRAGGGTLAERVAASSELSGQLGAKAMAAVFSHADAIDAAARAAQVWLEQRRP